MDPVIGLKTLKRKEVVKRSHYGKKSGGSYGICLDFEALWTASHAG
jgi:hypothetical protein